MDSSRGRMGAEPLAKISGERIEEDIFDREFAARIAVQLAPSFGLADVQPVGGFIGRSGEAVGFHKGLQQHRAIVVTRFPVSWQAPCGHRQYHRGQVFRLDPRQDQEAGVIDYPVQMFFSLIVIPADVGIAWRGLPGAGAGRDPAAARTAGCMRAPLPLPPRAPHLDPLGSGHPEKIV